MLHGRDAALIVHMTCRAQRVEPGDAPGDRPSAEESEFGVAMVAKEAVCQVIIVSVLLARSEPASSPFRCVVSMSFANKQTQGL